MPRAFRQSNMVHISLPLKIHCWTLIQQHQLHWLDIKEKTMVSPLLFYYLGMCRDDWPWKCGPLLNKEWTLMYLHTSMPKKNYFKWYQVFRTKRRPFVINCIYKWLDIRIGLSIIFCMFDIAKLLIVAEVLQYLRFWFSMHFCSWLWITITA